MNSFVDALSHLTKLSASELPAENNESITVHEGNFSDKVSTLFRQVGETDEQFKNVINTLSQSPQFTSDPEKLSMLQNYLGEYTNYVSLISTLARKGVSTIETLEKSQ